jgi:hypothetical protein
MLPEQGAVILRAGICVTHRDRWCPGFVCTSSVGGKWHTSTGLCRPLEVPKQHALQVSACDSVYSCRCQENCREGRRSFGASGSGRVVCQQKQPGSARRCSHGPHWCRLGAKATMCDSAGGWYWMATAFTFQGLLFEFLAMGWGML